MSTTSTLAKSLPLSPQQIAVRFEVIVRAVCSILALAVLGISIEMGILPGDYADNGSVWEPYDSRGETYPYITMVFVSRHKLPKVLH